MINAFAGEFLFHPAAIEISGNTCNHQCFYCFANIRTKHRAIRLKSIINRLTLKTPKTYLDNLISEGYPICLSNNSDPFARNNYIDTLSIAPYLFKLKNGLFVQTKGGYGIDKFVELAKKTDKKNIMFYVSITSYNEKIIKQIEPNAPSINERLNLVEYFLSEGFGVVVAYNPLCEQWLPYNDMVKLTDKLIALGVKNIIVEPLHFSPPEYKTLKPDKQQLLIEPYKSQAITTFSRQKPTKKFETYLWKVLKYLQGIGINSHKLGAPVDSELFNVYREHLGLIFPGIHDVINYCFTTDYANGYILTYDKCQEILCKDNPDFFDKEFKGVNAFVLRASFEDWKGNRKLQSINTLNGVFNMFWNYKRAKMSLQRNYLFRLIIDDKGNTIKDSKNNLMLYFDGEIHHTDRTICLTNN